VSFLMIDKIIQVHKGEKAIALRTFSPDEDYLADHFPGYPVVPGNLLTESMAQTGGLLIAYSHDFLVFPLLVMVGHVKFRRLVHPGKELHIEAEIVSASTTNCEISAKVHQKRALIAEARLFFCPCSDQNGPIPGKTILELCKWQEDVFEDLASGMT